MFNFFHQNTGSAINVNDLDQLTGSVELIDIREPYEFQSGSIKGAKNIPMNTLLGNPKAYLKSEGPYYIVCQSGGRSQRACGALIKEGYNVINVAGGVGSYCGTRRQ